MIDPNHDIVPSLRLMDGLLFDKAADEIERLRAELQQVKDARTLTVQINAEEMVAAVGREVHAALDQHLTTAARDVLAERQRQQDAKGWTPESDDEWVCDELAALACAYIMPPAARDWDASSTGFGDTLVEAMVPEDWQFRSEDRRSDLRKGAALVLAEIERLDRAAEKGSAA